ncbi:hypothetical protein FQA39_LY17823 [Lamprigera yunnana]|nr:hypothetical protein FQA39_LY17823 [Lamprigera yunnana]
MKSRAISIEESEQERILGIGMSLTLLILIYNFMIRDRSPIIFNKINSDIINHYKMANFSKINLARKMIPNYEGGSKNLSYFIQQCEKFILNYKKDEKLVENNTFNKLLFEICCSQLIGNARDVLVISNCVTWTEVKNALISRFGDARNETLLENDLKICYQLSNQTYDEYYEVIKSKLQQLLEHLTIKEANLELKVFKTDLYNSKALETFKAGLLEPHRSFISYQTVTSLEDCILQLRNYDNHKRQVNFLNFIRQKPTNRNFVRNINTHNKPQFQKLTQPNHSFNNPNRFNSPNFNHNFYKTNQFNSNPNYKNTHNNFPTFPNATNTSSDGNRYPRNQYNFNYRKPEYKPTPMSISTRNTNRSRGTPNHFQATGPANFISEELYNVEDVCEINDNSLSPDDYEQSYPSHAHELEDVPSTSYDTTQNFTIKASDNYLT